MNPVVIDIGPLELRAYTAWLIGGILLGLVTLLWRAYAYNPRALLPWLDVSLAGLGAGVIGARVLHVALEWEYFVHHTNQITKLWMGGMAWHGGLVAALPVVWIVARWRGVDLRAWTDALAIAWPLGMIGAWTGCRDAGCGYGYEVATLADWPSWLVAELPDVFGLYAPRLDVQAFGTRFGALLVALALLLTALNWLRGLRLWLILALSSLGLALLGFVRADPAQMIVDYRADQVFNLVLLLLSTVTGCALWLRDRRTAAEFTSPPRSPLV
ncbi:MAG: prolipoprotein diacylglyceryl transferase [Anaerolineae bacterium]|nr:prolipoprotein diacylglyceryl transferase [Anaerolineae bacterium]